MKFQVHVSLSGRTGVARVLVGCLWGLLAGCAAMVETTPAQLSRASPTQPVREVVMSRPANIKLATGYSRELAAGSRWQFAGTIAQGDVYRPPIGSVFSIEGHHVHEAYLVIRENRLQGFYLPGESRYSPLVPSLPLSLGTYP